jgi:hypothetical protein
VRGVSRSGGGRGRAHSQSSKLARERLITNELQSQDEEERELDKGLSGPANDPDESGDQRSAEGDTEQDGFDLVEDECLDSRLVEPVTLFDHERPVCLCREGDEAMYTESVRIPTELEKDHVHAEGTVQSEKGQRMADLHAP